MESANLIIRLKDWATEKKMPQREIAALLGVRNTAVSNWYTGRNRPSYDVGVRIQRLLDEKESVLPKES